MKVILIGGAGYIGRPLVRQLRERGVEVLSADIRNGDGVDEVVDMRNAGDVYRLLLRHRPDRVLVTAYLLSRATTADPVRAVETNVLGLTNVFQAAADVGVSRVVFAASGAIFGANADFPRQPLDETVYNRPRILYAKMKQFNEWMAEHYNATTAAEIVSFRISGPHGKGKATGGATPYDTVVNAIGKQPSITLPWSRDTSFRFIHLEDAAASFIPIVLAAELKHHVYNAPGFAVPMPVLAETAERVGGIRVDFADPGQHIEFVARIDSGRYEAEFDFRPRPMADWMREESAPTLAPSR
jgi:UDP-glucose 4-epimerase